MANLDTIPIYKKKPYTPYNGDGGVERQRVVIVGSGPIGLAIALDMAQRGRDVLIVTAFDFIPRGSKAICFSKQSLDIFDRLGVGERVVDKGVTWNVGKVFWGDNEDPVFEFDILPVKDQKNPGFVNIQQYYVEDYLVDAVEASPNIEIRWGHRVSDIDPSGDGATLSVSTRDGDYKIMANYVLACDGSKSLIRTAMGLDFEGRVFEDNFLIADVKFKQQRPSERWFWFDPPFNPGQTALLHKQPDNVWRLDFQLGWDIDRAAAIKSENVAPFIKGMIGDDVEYQEEWLSLYTFQCRRMERFVHGHVIFVGDSAHLVSPFGARGCNGGLADVHNLGWKLDLVLRDEAPKSLLQSYNAERVEGSDENIMFSTRSTDFMTPKDERSRSFRNAVLELSCDHEFARPFINSGRLSTPTPYRDSALSTPDRDDWGGGGVKPGWPAVDAPIEWEKHKWMLDALGRDFCLVHFGETPPCVEIGIITLPTDGLAARRFAAANGATYLIRPDQVVAARWINPTAEDILIAVERACGRG